MSADPLRLSVIVPAHNAAALLPRCLNALTSSTLARDCWELIVVDDGSTDETATVAGAYADVVVRLPGRAHGPAYARNRGFEASRGELAMFLDADCVAHPDTLQRVIDAFDCHPELGAVFGSYDDRPTAPGAISQYRNLVHHFVHHRNAGDVETFWAGAGAVQASVFAQAGMFDEWHYARPQIEDIELGARIRALGLRILLDPRIQVTHLKRWTLLTVIRTDIRDRGIPWARLLAHRGAALSSRTLNLRWTERLNTILTYAGGGLLAASAFGGGAAAALSGATCIIVVLLLNAPLWRFFIARRGLWFTLRVVPSHLLYYLMNGVSFGTGLLLQQLVGPPIPDPTIEAYAEVGVKRWPPIPSRNRPSSWTAE